MDRIQHRKRRTASHGPVSGDKKGRGATPRPDFRARRSLAAERTDQDLDAKRFSLLADHLHDISHRRDKIDILD